MAEKTNVPEIRFAGFTDPWEQRKLGDAGTTYGGLSGKTKEDFGHGEAQFVPYTNVFDNPVTDTERLESVEIDPNQNKVKYGDVFFTVSSETPDEVGMSSVWLSDQEDVYLNSFCFGYRQDSTFDPHYLAYMLRSSSVRSDLTLLAQGISRFNISKNKVMELSVPVPSAVEQKQIGQYFASLDHLITLHQRKYDKLVQLKKSMLDKLFPRPGERFPEIRFAGFTDPWEQRKLGELMDVTSVRRVRQEDWTDEGVRFLRARDLVAFAKNEAIDDPLFISDEMYREYSAQSGKVVVGDLLVTGVGTIGVPWLVTSENPVYFKDGNIIWFKNQNAVDGEFFYHSFTAHAIQRYIKEAAGIGTVGTYTIETGKKTPIWLPLEREQRQIAAFMTSLDTLITLHQRKLELLRNTKKSLLDRMFA